VDNMNLSFVAELRARTEQLAETQEALRGVSRDLAETRRSMEAMKQQKIRGEDMQQRIKDLEAKLELENVENRKLKQQIEMANNKLLTNSKPVNEQVSTDPPPSIVTSKELESKLKEPVIEETSAMEEIKLLSSKIAHQETAFKKILASCLKLDYDQVDKLVHPLIQQAIQEGNSEFVNNALLEGFVKKAAEMRSNDANNLQDFKL